MTTASEWNGFKRKDPVRVIGERGQFVFLYVSYNSDGSVNHVTCSGGIANHSQLRAFSPERIKAPVKKRVKKVSSVD
jgi:hypothetical protein